MRGKDRPREYRSRFRGRDWHPETETLHYTGDKKGWSACGVETAHTTGLFENVSCAACRTKGR